MSNPSGPEHEQPPLGQPIPLDRDKRDDGDQAPAGEHVVVIPQTAGSAGTAHKES